VSDGYTTIQLQSKFSRFQCSQAKSIVPLFRGNAPLCPDFPQLAPQYGTTAETNGAFLSFVLIQDWTSAICRVFSVESGVHIVDEELQLTDHISSVCFDAVNQCHWMLVMMGNSCIGVHRFHSPGAMNPHVFSFTPL
jgi:hypothetical protein